MAANISYENNGLSWDVTEGDNRACGLGRRQSPIDLQRGAPVYGEEKFEKYYQNVYPDGREGVSGPLGKVSYKEKSSAVYTSLDGRGWTEWPDPNMPNGDSQRYFRSSTGAQMFGFDELYTAKQLHFHTKSEHEIHG